MISRFPPWTILLSLGFWLFSGSTYPADCLDIDFSNNKGHKVKDNFLLVHVNQSAVAGAISIKRDEQGAAKIILRREFTKYFQLLENWNFLEIKSSKGIYGLLRCNDQTIYFFEINLSDVQVSRLAPSEVPVLSLSELDMFETNKDSVAKFDKFK